MLGMILETKIAVGQIHGIAIWIPNDSDAKNTRNERGWFLGHFTVYMYVRDSIHPGC